MNVHIYKATFDLLQRDFEQLLEYVEPADANLSCFSHRSYALLLRACTEFESLAKDLLVKSGDKTPRSAMKVNHYRALENSLHLDPCDVTYLDWRPHPRRVTPFRKWSSAQPPLDWYRRYNTVKHNRDAEFHLANLEALLEALGALFLLTAKASRFDWRPNGGWSRDSEGITFTRGPFQFWDPSGAIKPGESGTPEFLQPEGITTSPPASSPSQSPP